VIVPLPYIDRDSAAGYAIFPDFHLSNWNFLILSPVQDQERRALSF
jgi:hypothetical protein